MTGRLILRLALLPTLVLAPAAATARDYILVKIADATDLPGAFARGSAALPPDMNAGGEVAFWALRRAYVGNGLVLDERARTVADDPASPFLNVGIPAIDDSGTIAFYAGFDQPLQSTIGAEAIVTVNRTGSFTAIAGQADRDPTQPFGGRFGQLPDITGNGTVFFTGVLAAGPDGVGRGIGGVPSVIVDAGTSEIDRVNQGARPSGNRLGNVVFLATLDSGEQAVVTHRGGSVLVLAHSATVFYSPASLNDGGAVAFAELLPAPTGGQTGRLVTTQDGIGFQTIAETGRDGLVPGFLYPPSVNGAVDVVFLAEDARGRTGLYIGDGRTVEPVVALPNGVIDGHLGGLIALGPRALNDAGQIAFSAGEQGVYRLDPIGGGSGCGSCDDRDPCTVDVAAPGGCTHDPVDDPSDVSRHGERCAAAALPGFVGRQYLAGCRFLARASGTGNTRKARRLFGKAARGFTRARDATARAGARRRRPVPGECTAVLTCVIDAAKRYADLRRSAL